MGQSPLYSRGKGSRNSNRHGSNGACFLSSKTRGNSHAKCWRARQDSLFLFLTPDAHEREHADAAVLDLRLLQPLGGRIDGTRYRRQHDSKGRKRATQRKIDRQVETISHDLRRRRTPKSFYPRASITTGGGSGYHPFGAASERTNGLPHEILPGSSAYNTTHGRTASKQLRSFHNGRIRKDQKTGPAPKEGPDCVCGGQKKKNRHWSQPEAQLVSSN